MGFYFPLPHEGHFPQRESTLPKPNLTVSAPRCQVDQHISGRPPRAEGNLHWLKLSPLCFLLREQLKPSRSHLAPLRAGGPGHMQSPRLPAQTAAQRSFWVSIESPWQWSFPDVMFFSLFWLNQYCCMQTLPWVFSSFVSRFLQQFCLFHNKTKIISVNKNGWNEIRLK